MRDTIATERLEPRSLLSVAAPGLFAVGHLATAVSADGSTVVGQVYGSAFRWTPAAGLQTLPLISGFENMIASGVSADGTVVIGAGQDSGGFRWTEAGGYELLRPADPSTNYRMGASATSADGTAIVGSVRTDSFGTTGAFLWTEDGGFQQLPNPGPGYSSRATSVSADGSVVVGYADRGTPGIDYSFESFRWTPQGGTVWLRHVPDHPFDGQAEAVSGDGSTVVGVGSSSDGVGAVSWTPTGGEVHLGDLTGGDDESAAYAVNAVGSVIVGTSSTGRESEAFVWDNVHGMRRLADVLADDGVNTSGWLLRTAYAVSGDGTVIAGEGSYNGSFSTGFVAMLDRPLIGPPPEVSGRHVFYNHSAYDGGDASADPRDLAAVAPDKTALLPGQAPTFDNVTSYSRGINGVLVDFAGRPPTTLTAEDFTFRYRGASPTDSWAAAPPPAQVASIAPPVGADVARYAITWPDGAIRNGWLEVTVKANERTGLAAPDVFYFGNLIGETGDAASPRSVTSRDVAAVRGALGGPSDLAGHYDFDRDGRVGATDLAAVRRNIGHTLAGPFDKAADSYFAADTLRSPLKRSTYNPLLT